MMLAADAEGHEITTVEGLGTPDRMSTLQAAFVEADAMQGGFCTPGFVVVGTVLLKTNPSPTLDEVKAASPQIRSVATIGGNVVQRSRCWYYRLESFRCLKKGGDECFAWTGENSYHAILGGSFRLSRRS